MMFDNNLINQLKKLFIQIFFNKTTISSLTIVTTFCRLNEVYNIFFLNFCFSFSKKKFSKKILKKNSQKKLRKETRGGFFLPDPKFLANPSKFFSDAKINFELTKNKVLQKKKKTLKKTKLIKKNLFNIIKINKFFFLKNYFIVLWNSKSTVFENISYLKVSASKKKYFNPNDILPNLGKQNLFLIRFFTIYTKFFFFFNSFDTLNFLLKEQSNRFFASLYLKKKLNKRFNNNLINFFFLKKTKSNKILDLNFFFLKLYKKYKLIKLKKKLLLNYFLAALINLKKEKIINLIYYPFEIIVFSRTKKNFFLYSSPIFRTFFFLKKRKKKVLINFLKFKHMRLNGFYYLADLLEFFNSKYFLYGNTINLFTFNNFLFSLSTLKSNFFTSSIFNTTFNSLEDFFFWKKRLLIWAQILQTQLWTSFQVQLSGLQNHNIAKMLMFILVKNGKKLKARKLFFNFLLYFQKKYNLPGLIFFIHAILILEPKVWLKKKKIAGKIYEIPIYISSRRSKSIAIWWLLLAAKKKKTNLAEGLATEVLNVAFSKGLSISYWDALHSTVLKNKALLRWTS